MDFLTDEEEEFGTGDGELTLSEASDELEEYVYDEDDDPDYVPSVPLEVDVDGTADERLSETQSSSGNVECSTPVNNDNQNIEPPRPVEAEERSIILASQRSTADETCSICFEPWTNSSEHRLVSLRCGHLFGRSCISQWLKGQNSRCPQCNARARKSEIRNIYARSLKVIDSTERDNALKELMKESEMRRAAEMAAAEERIKHHLAIQECERLKKELMKAQKQLQEFRSNSRQNTVSSQVSNTKSVFRLLETININKDGGCRIVNSCDFMGMFLVSQPSTNPLFPGFGIRKVSFMDMKPHDFVLIHKKLIRDMDFHAQEGLLLTASIDKSLKITNVFSNTVVQTYQVESDVWSCTWDSYNPLYFYGGLKTGETYVFDIRVTNKYVRELPRFGTKTPVISLQFLKSDNYGPVVGTLSGCALYQKTQTEGNYNLIPLPALGPITCLNSYNQHILVSCRPSLKQPRTSHTFCDFVSTPAGEVISCPVKTVFGGRTQIQLTRSKMFNHPDEPSSVLICAGDEEAKGALVWDGMSGDILDKLETDSPVVDLSSMISSQKLYMAALTNKTMELYKWNQQ